MRRPSNDKLMAGCQHTRGSAGTRVAAYPLAVGPASCQELSTQPLAQAA